VLLMLMMFMLDYFLSFSRLMRCAAIKTMPPAMPLMRASAAFIRRDAPCRRARAHARCAASEFLFYAPFIAATPRHDAAMPRCADMPFLIRRLSPMLMIALAASMS